MPTMYFANSNVLHIISYILNWLKYAAGNANHLALTDTFDSVSPEKFIQVYTLLHIITSHSFITLQIFYNYRIKLIFPYNYPTVSIDVLFTVLSLVTIIM